MQRYVLLLLISSVWVQLAAKLVILCGFITVLRLDESLKLALATAHVGVEGNCPKRQ